MLRQAAINLNRELACRGLIPGLSRDPTALPGGFKRHPLAANLFLPVLSSELTELGINYNQPTKDQLDLGIPELSF